MKKLFLMTAITLSLSTQASILLEPQLGYVVNHNADSQITVTRNGVTSNANVSASGTAAELGLSAGVQYFGFMAGGSVTQGASDKGLLTGVFIGFNAPILLRAWATYNFKSEINYGSTETDGSSVELGVGFTALPLLSLNLIYRKYDMDELSISGIPYTTTGLKPSEIILAVSAPLTF